MTTSTTVFLILSMTAAVVVGYGSRPPVDVDSTLCDTMLPVHGKPTPVGDAPYTLTVTKEHDGTYTVRLAGEYPAVVQGFFIQARPWDSSSSSEKKPVDSVGTFASSAPKSQLLPCFGKEKNAWGHSHSSGLRSVDATWTPPKGSGEVRFRATVVQKPDFRAYWLDVYSKIVTY